MKKKSKEVKTGNSRKIERQLNILSRYYKIDREKNVIELVLKAEKASDLLEKDVVTLDYPRFNTETISRVYEIMESFPTGFKVDLILKIDDYEGYDPNVLLGSLKDSLELFHYALNREKNKNWLLATALIMIASVILFFRIFFVQNNMLDGNGLLNEMVDITAWAFLWEGVTILFLASSERKEMALSIGKRLLSISLRDKDDKTLLTIARADYVREWISDSRRKTIGKALMVISGAACIVTALMNIVDTSFRIYKALNGGETVALFSIISSYVESALFAIGGVGIIQMFREKGKLQVIVPFFAYTFLVFDTLIFIIVILINILTGEFNLGLILGAIKSLLVTILYFVSYLIVKVFKSMEIKEANKTK